VDLSDHQAMSTYSNAGVSQGHRYRISIAVDVINARALWNAALSRGLMAPGATFEDVVDTIGPCDDPAIADCLAMLALPADLKGCSVEDFAIDPALPRGVIESSLPWTGLSAAR
jgi:hypothetical protein